MSSRTPRRVIDQRCLFLLSHCPSYFSETAFKLQEGGAKMQQKNPHRPGHNGKVQFVN
jgi:hypothetical protein